MKPGDLVTLSARGWKLEYPQRWLKRKLRSAGIPYYVGDYRKEARSSYVGMVLREGSTGTILVKWLTGEGPPGPWAQPYWGKGKDVSLWDRGHLKFVSKGKG